MLVLNTNEQWNSWQVLSNTMIRAYPDFKSLLLYPNIDWYINELKFNSSTLTTDNVIDYAYGMTAFEVNWTKVNISNQTLNENLLLVWWLTWWNIWNLNRIFASSSYLYFYTALTAWKVSKIIRLWISETLEWWEIIWKKITTSFWRKFEFNSWQALYSQPNLSMKIWLVYRLWLLHSDWSITYWDWIEPPEYLSPEMRTVWNDTTTRQVWASNKLVEITTNWLTAVVWDRIIFEFWPRVYWSWLSSNIWWIQFHFEFFFWRRWSPTDVEIDYNSSRTSTELSWNTYLWWNMRWRPIQISIE